MSEEKHYLITKLKETRNHIVELVMEREDILLQQNPAIEAEYMVKVGAYELKCAEAELAARRAKRKFALCQAQVNSGNLVDEEQIEDELDAELEQWMIDVQQKQVQVFSLLDRRSSSTIMSQADSKKLKEIYRKLCKRLHPDLNPLLNEYELNLFSGIQKAYERGDLATLEAYVWLLDEPDKIDDSKKDEEELTAEIALLEAQATVQEEMLEDLKNKYPYNMAVKLSNANWVFETVREFKTKTKDYLDIKNAYDEEIRNLLTELKK